MMKNKAIHIEGLSKSYRIGHRREKTLRGSLGQGLLSLFRPSTLYETFWALQDINLDVAQGEILGIIGRNGAGKTTLLKLLSRITYPSRGHFEIHGRVASLLEVGTGFHPELSGRENIFLNGTILGMTRQEVRSRFDEIVDFSGIEHFLDTPVKRYSSGMFVRLAFSVAAHLEPEVLIIDEVLAVGDAGFQKKCLGKMDKVAQGGRTILFVSHNLGAIGQLCQRAVCLERGKIKNIGNTSAVIKDYLEMYQDGEGQIEKRYGDRKFEFTYWRLVGENGEARNEFGMGEGLHLRFGLYFKEDITALIFGISIQNALGERITHLLNIDDHFNISGKSGEHKEILVKLNDIFLVPGSYRISIGLETYGVDHDVIEDALHFNMVQSDKVGRSVSYPENVKIYIPGKWELL